MVGREWKYNKGEFVKTLELKRSVNEEVTTEDGTKITKPKVTIHAPFVGQIVAKRGFGGDTVHEYLIRPGNRGMLAGGEFLSGDNAPLDIWVSDTEIEGKA